MTENDAMLDVGKTIRQTEKQKKTTEYEGLSVLCT